MLIADLNADLIVPLPPRRADGPIAPLPISAALLPTDAPPGSEEKIAILERRAGLRIKLHVEGDAQEWLAGCRDVRKAGRPRKSLAD
jgi:hypothetical protein